MKIKFLGAAQNVTGSRFLLEVGKDRVLIDCGLFQERAFQNRNWDAFPIDPSSITHILLTHAHIDHCGYLPRLVKEGFKGDILSTAPSVDIAKVSLLDSAKLQEADARYKLKRHKRAGHKGAFPIKPLYSTDDVIKTFKLFKKINFRQDINITKNIKATFYEAGHILGAAMIRLEITENNNTQVVVFSGDIGRCNRPILEDPHVFKSADHVIMEATYGNRLHENEDNALAKLEDVISNTAQKGGNVIIPTFAIGRTQELLYDLNILLKNKRIPHLITFVDSPMAIDVTEIFKRYPEYFDDKAQELLDEYKELFNFPLLKFTPSSDESKAINHIKGSAIIMAGSGMCTGGRVKYHLARNITRAESTILFVGYQANGTLGRIILERPKQVRILGKTYPVKARIEKINGFSAHADKDELLSWIASFKKKPKNLFIVHSEENTAAQFATSVQKKIGMKPQIPEYLQEYEL